MYPSEHETHDIPGYEGLYAISFFGRVWSWKRRTGKWLTPSLSRKVKGKPTNYASVGLFDAEGKAKYLSVHRLVALTFLPNPDNLPEVNHLDGDKSNNWVGNLEWTDRLRNATHARVTGLYTHASHSFLGLNFSASKGQHNCWVATVYVDGEVRTIGNFATPLMALTAHNQTVVTLGLDRPLHDLDSLDVQAQIGRLSRMKPALQPKSPLQMRRDLCLHATCRDSTDGRFCCLDCGRMLPSKTKYLDLMKLKAA